MVLYHYTTAAGLKCIIKSKSIWASDYRFLSDATEFRYGLDIFKHIFFEAIPATTFPSDVIDLIKKRLRLATSEDFSVFIAAFSKQPDLLSQWRGYNDARGYSIGINADWLDRNAEAQEFRLFPVRYNIEEQRQAVHDKLHLLRRTLDERAKTETVFETVNKWWWKQLLYTIAAP